MREVLSSLLQKQADGEPVVYTALIETRGSTPQKAGASMLVCADGSQVGTLGGGCVEAEVKRKALESLGTGLPEIAVFQLDHDYGWDDGLICGGRMTMLIAPVLPGDAVQYYREYLQLLDSGRGCLEAIRFESEGESPRQPGERFLFGPKGELVSHLNPQESTATPAAELLQQLRLPISRPRPYVAQGVAFLPQLPHSKLVIVGAGHVGKKLAEYAADVDFEVTVIDDRELYCNAANLPGASHCLVGEFDDVLPELEIDEQTYCVIVTRGHNHDEEALLHLIRRAPAYLGMIGSKRKIRLIFEDLQRQGVTPELLQQVHAPIGLEIGSQTVPEIAISIVAQLIQARNQSGATPHSQSDGT